MAEVIHPNDFAAASRESVVIDVRTPSEFARGHIVGAFNVPLFDDEQRAEVGTIYVKKGRKPAFLRGLELVGGRLADIAREAEAAAQGRDIIVYCWRGGMRSGSVCWLLENAGMKVRQLKGGYKAYRGTLEPLVKRFADKIVVVSGPTGGGKSVILRKLAQRGEQFLDLEELARHKGSAFGGLWQEQETTEMFINRIVERLWSFDPSKRLWIEGESRTIGKVVVPESLYEAMKNSRCVYMESSVEKRLERIEKEYGCIDRERLSAAFDKITKRLGLEQCLKAKEAVERGDISEAAAIALKYYDKGYKASIDKSYDKAKMSYIDVTEYDDDEAAEKLLALVENGHHE